MKVRVVPSRRDVRLSTVEVSEGCQFFRLDYTGTKSEATWYAEQFRIALNHHNRFIRQAPSTKRYWYEKFLDNLHKD